MALHDDEIAERKNAIRAQAHANRQAQADKDAVSQRITDRLHRMPQYQSAATVMYYVDVRDEVRTRHALSAALASEQRIVVPFCVDGELQLFHLESMAELETGMYKILEPRADLRDRAAKRVAVAELDLVVVPGVAFDRSGGRTGQGKGYYDKLLEHAQAKTSLVSLAFECQMFPEIPVAAHDIAMDFVVTEAAVYAGRGRS
ncbi:5-formyltetrahydrofolate cyclo-ligase family protein [Rosistilla carotiformis]|uniref:5-formyltetrahydrofolate cyclo-ligase n=1 Tax=Rosistilla carotiformis TaxID=2528017 RepID=A0A518JQM2_9BACT|nr:5-formyltetrahydrofolate cyclo-ligase [Rosistilla carotiformis]QDV67847.1 5-formyltetrahydrofolate cyclo-ligase family protein [Rosistilla carotiformis]